MDLITRKLTLDQVDLSDWAKKLVEESEDKSIIRKGISQSDYTFVEGERAAIFVATNSKKDRDGDILVSKNLNIKNFEKAGKPIQWAHRYDQISLGSAQWVKWDKNSNSVLVKVKFGKHQFATDVFEHLKEHPLSMSIGFIPTKYMSKEDFHKFNFKELGIDPEEAKSANSIILEADLLEASIVPVPANPYCSMLAVSKGLISEAQLNDLGYIYEVKDMESKSLCDCESSEYDDNDECKACGGKRKPKKEVDVEIINDTKEDTLIEVDKKEVEIEITISEGEKKMECPGCGAEVSEDDEECPECGEKLKSITEEVVEEKIAEGIESTPSIDDIVDQLYDKIKSLEDKIEEFTRVEVKEPDKEDVVFKSSIYLNQDQWNEVYSSWLQSEKTISQFCEDNGFEYEVRENKQKKFISNLNSIVEEIKSFDNINDKYQPQIKSIIDELSKFIPEEKVVVEEKSIEPEEFVFETKSQSNDIDFDNLTTVTKSVLSKLLNDNVKSFNLDDIVQEAINKQKGKVF